MIRIRSAVVIGVIALFAAFSVHSDGNAKPERDFLEEKNETCLKELNDMGTITLNMLFDKRNESLIASQATSVYALFSIVPRRQCNHYTFPCTNSTEFKILAANATELVAEVHVITNPFFNEICSEEENAKKMYFSRVTDKASFSEVGIEKLERWYKCGEFTMKDVAKRIVIINATESTWSLWTYLGLIFITVVAATTVTVHFYRCLFNPRKNRSPQNAAVRNANAPRRDQIEMQVLRQADPVPEQSSGEGPSNRNESPAIAEDPHTTSTTDSI